MSIELIWDKSNCVLEYQGTTIHAAPRDYPPFAPQAIIEEQDTALLLNPQTTLHDPGKPAWYLANTLEDNPSHPLGSVVVKGHQPRRLLAIVHDIERSPTCQPEFIQTAWLNVMTVIQENQFTTASMPLLGTVHGKISVKDALVLLGESLRKNQPTCLEKVWLILPNNCGCEVLAQLSHSTTNGTR